MARSFRAAEGRTITLPQRVQAGAGATNMRLHPGGVVTLDDETCTAEQRFINGRLRAGDLVEVAVGTESAPDSVENLRPPDATKPMLKPATAGTAPPKSKESDR